MVKQKKPTINSEGLMEKISAIFKFYLEGITILFLFLPGILYQTNFSGADISQYNGLSIILFLAISFYYSLPFIIAGTFIRMIEEGKKDFDRNKHSSFAIGIFAVAIYFTSIITPSWMFFVEKITGYAQLNSWSLLVGNTSLDFWGRFFLMAVFFSAFTYVDKRFNSGAAK